MGLAMETRCWVREVFVRQKDCSIHDFVGRAVLKMMEQCLSQTYKDHFPKHRAATNLENLEKSVNLMRTVNNSADNLFVEEAGVHVPLNIVSRLDYCWKSSRAYAPNFLDNDVRTYPCRDEYLRGCPLSVIWPFLLPPLAPGTVCVSTSRPHPLCLFSEDAWRLFSSGVPLLDSLPQLL